MNIKQWVWHQTGRFNLQLESYYYYLRIMRLLEAEVFLVDAIAHSDGIALDIGANFGVWSYHLSKIFYQVEAFEPIPECCAVIGNTHCKNIHVHNEALSSVEGNMELHIPVGEGRMLLQSASLGEIKGKYNSRIVPVKRLDDYMFDGVRFIKIDVEGYETEVLKGAEETITKCMPAMIVEIEQRHLSYPMDSVFKMLNAYGYNAFFLSGNKLRSYEQFSYKLNQEPYLDNPSSVAYIHNFVFLPK